MKVTMLTDLKELQPAPRSEERGAMRSDFPETLRKVRESERTEARRREAEDDAARLEAEDPAEDPVGAPRSEEEPTDGVGEPGTEGPEGGAVAVSPLTVPSAGPAEAAPATESGTPAGLDGSATASVPTLPRPAERRAASAAAQPGSEVTMKTPTPSTGSASAEGETAAPVIGEGSRGRESAPAPLAAREALAARSAPETAGSGWFSEARPTAETDAGSSFRLLAEADGPDAAVERPQPASARPSVPPPVEPSLAPTGTVELTRPEGTAPTAPLPGPARAEGTAAAPAPVVISADPSDRTALPRRIFRQVGRALARGDHELHVRLDPPRLGRVEVDLRIEAEVLKVRFVVETEEVRDALRAQIDDLHRSLDAHGSRAESVEIDLREDPAGRGGAERRDTSAAGRGSEEPGPENPAPDRELRLWHLGKTVDLKG